MGVKFTFYWGSFSKELVSAMKEMRVPAVPTNVLRFPNRVPPAYDFTKPEDRAIILEVLSAIVDMSEYVLLFIDLFAILLECLLCRSLAKQKKALAKKAFLKAKKWDESEVQDEAAIKQAKADYETCIAECTAANQEACFKHVMFGADKTPIGLKLGGIIAKVPPSELSKSAQLGSNVNNNNNNAQPQEPLIKKFKK